MAESQGRSALSTAVLVIGAAAGLAIFFSLIGALVSWARFYALDLPSDAASATLSQSTLLLRGVTALTGPFIAGLAAAGLSIFLRRVVPTGSAVSRSPWRSRYFAAGVACALILILIALVFDYPRVALNIALGGLLVIGSLTPWGRAHRDPVVINTILACMVGLGIAQLVWGVFRPPTYLERAEVTFSDGRPPLHGFWIAGTPDTVYVAPRAEGPNGPCQVTGEILAFRRDDVLSIRFEPAVEVWSQHRTPAPEACR